MDFAQTLILEGHTVVVGWKEQNAFIAHAPHLPGIVSQGKTRDEALRKIRDALESHPSSSAAWNEIVPSV